MPRVNPYVEQVTAKGDNTDFQDPNTADAGIGAAMRSIGGSVNRLVQQHKAIEDDQGKMWAANATAQNEVAQQKAQLDRINALDPSAPDYVDKVNALPETMDADYQASTQTLMESAPNNAARKYVTMHAAGGRVRTMSNAVSTSAELNANYAVSQVNSAVKSSSDILAGSPDNDTFNSINDQNRQTIMALTTVDPDTKLKLADSAQSTYANVQVASLVSQDPHGFLKMVNADGGYTNARGVAHGQVPTVQNYNADTVRPYSADQAQGIAAKVAAPSQYDALFQQAAAKHGVDPAELKMRAVAESGLNPNASSGQANGIMQLAPGTAAALGVDANDPAQAIDAAAGLLAKYQKAAGGDQSAVDMMYYGGEDQAHWGPNTRQYASNLGAARTAMGGVASDPQVRPLDEQDIVKASPGIAGWDKLAWPEKVKYVRQAESSVGQGLAEDRGALTRELQDAKVALLNGQPYPGLDSPRYSEANLSRVFGPDEGGRMTRSLQYDSQVGNFMSAASTMPAAQRSATLASLAPTGGDDAAAREPVYRAAVEAAQRVQAQQQANPIQSAIASGIAGAKPLDFSQPDTLGAQMHNRTAVAATMMRDYGTKAQIFTGKEVDQLAGAIGKLSGKDRIGLLGSIRVGLSDSRSFATAMNELAPKNPNLAYAANLAAKGGVAYVGGTAQQPADIAATIADGDIILNGRNLDRQMAKGDDPSMPGGSKAVDFDETNFRNAFQQTLGGAFQSPDAQRSAATQQETYNAAKAYYVAESYRQGKSLSVIDPTGVNNAIEAVVGTPWKGVGVGGTLLAPYGVPVEKFQQEWFGRAQQALLQSGYNENDAKHIMDKTVPINLADGKYGFQQGTRLQTDARGHPVVVDYHGIYVVPAPASEGPTVATGLPMMRRN